MSRDGVRSLHGSLAAELARSAFDATAPRPEQIGAEVELIPVASGTRRPPALAELLIVLREVAAQCGWTLCTSPKGVPSFHVPGGGRVTFEPGGQIEYSAPPLCSASLLLASLRDAVLPLRAAATDRGIDLLSVGLDPDTPPVEAPRQISGERYERMEAYFERIGPAGVRMMRQTASMQVCVDNGPDPVARWRLLNALAPVLTAVFANSPLYAGASVGTPTARARTWREVDRVRTGVLPGERPADEYVSFALAAPDMMRTDSDGVFAPFGEWATHQEFSASRWATHLSTLFPEVRPRGYFEVRSCDAISPEWYAAPLAFIGGLTLHHPSMRTAAELLGAPNGEWLERASRRGLADPSLADLAHQLFEIALAGCRALGSRFMSGADLEAAAEYCVRFTARGLAPADEMLAARRAVAA